MNWTSLIQPKYAPDAFINGQFFVIKYTPDLVSQQIFNLGVAFIQDDTQKLHYRLLDSSLKGFTCVYGSEAVHGLRLLLQAIAYSLDNIGYVSSPSPQISYTPLLPTKGLSLIAIMESLYRDYIHMDHFEKKKPKKLPYINTSDLRQGLYDNLKQNSKDRYYRETKIILKGEIALDLPIWKEPNRLQNDLFDTNHLFASIVSADYVDDEALSYNIDYLGCTNVQNAYDMLQDKKPKAGLYIYRPALSERINREALNRIDNHIDNSLYLLNRLKKRDNLDIEIEVFDSEEAIFNKVNEFLA